MCPGFWEDAEPELKNVRKRLNVHLFMQLNTLKNLIAPRMKSTNRIVLVAVMMCLGFSFSQLSAQDKNDLLFLQSLEKLDQLALVPYQIKIHQAWREGGVRKIRIQDEGDVPGTYQQLIEFDASGNITHFEDSRGKDRVLQYDRKGRLKHIAASVGGNLDSELYFYYDRKGDLKRSVLKYTDSGEELIGMYDSSYRLNRVSRVKKGIVTKSTNIQYTYDELGMLTGVNMPGMKATYLYKADRLEQMQMQSVGKQGQFSFVYEGERLTTIKQYTNKDGDLILARSMEFAYNDADLLARLDIKSRHDGAPAEINNFYYDKFQPAKLAMRGDWDGGGYGYGTPVIVQWSNPELDTRVTDSLLPIRFDLKPGVGQEMPDIKSVTLRLNHKLTKKEIGNVVLQKKGEGNIFFVEEELPLLEGDNTVFLEVETELGKFTSGERYITYKNPKRQIKVSNLHVLAIGVSDYDVDALDLPYVGNDIESIVSSLSAQQGKLFGEVKTQIISDKEATKANIEDAITRIKGRAAAEDLVLIYFAGQGEEWEGNFYLKPSDVKGERSELETSAIDNRWILEEISRYDAPALYFLDASHEVEGESTDVGTANLDEVKNDFEDVINSDDDIRIFMSSTSSKQKARINENSSFFAQALLEGISGKADEKGNGNGFVTVDELSEYVADRVLDMTSWGQKPAHVKRGIGLVPVAKVN